MQKEEGRMQKSLVVALLVATSLAAQQPQKATFAVPGQGTLRLTLPAGWTDREREPMTYEIRDAKNQLLLLITPLWSPKNDPHVNSAEEIREGITHAADEIQPTAVEKQLVVREIATSSGKGYYFTATDRAPKPGEYEYLANGAVAAGRLLVSFTVLSHSRDVERALAVVRSATTDSGALDH
jgi:hypothetical protein